MPLHFGRLHQRAPHTVPFSTAVITWLPIAVAITVGTMIRLAVFLVGGGKVPAAVGSVLCAGLGALGAVLWLRASEDRSGWPGLLRLSGTWVLLTILFRAAWIGLVIGAGWQGVTNDYHLADGQPALIMLAIIAAAPLIMAGRDRTAESPLD